MWFWFHSGWILILPLAVMVLCILMCFLMRWRVLSRGMGCCGHGHREYNPEGERRPQGDSQSSTG